MQGYQLEVHTSSQILWVRIEVNTIGFQGRYKLFCSPTWNGIVFMEGQSTCVVCSFLFGCSKIF